MNHSSPEVEAKVLDTTEERLLPRLKELGFQPYFRGILKAQWLVNPLNDQRLRVRQEGDIIMVEHKSPTGQGIQGIKSLKETGFEARDFDAVVETLGLVGLERAGLPSVKLRVSHVLNYDHPTDWIRLDFDTYTDLMGKYIPEFVEIESSQKENVYEMTEALGLKTSDLKNYGPVELFKHYYPNDTIS